MATKIYLDRKWRFKRVFSQDMIKASIEGAEIINIPHSVADMPYDYFDESIYQMVSCYQKSVFAPLQWEGKVIKLSFEGVAHSCKVYVNGSLCGSHDCGYTAFSCDVTGLLFLGQENLITVSVDSRESLNQPPFGYVVDYMTYGGIYRDVYFEVCSPSYIDDIFLQPILLEKLSTSKRTPKQIGQITTQGILKSDCYLPESVREYSKSQRLFIRQYMDGQLLLSQPAAGFESTEYGLKLSLATAPMSVKLWDIESPHLYTITTQLFLDDELVDEYTAKVGFRSSEFRKDGYYLNGRKVKLRGLNRHQSYPYVGYAMPESMQRYDAGILKKELALNAVRTSHYPQSHYFMDECDKIGLLVFTEIPGWQHIGDITWQDIAVKNTSDMIRQYRNHTSIILWGVRINESQDNDAFYKRTNELAHLLDPTRPTGGVRAHAKSSLLEDVYTYNDFSHSGDNAGCALKKDITSDEDKPYLVSEYNGHMYPTKMFDTEDHRKEHALRHAKVLDAIAGQKDIAGSFGWCMFDYNTHKDFGSGDRICYHGLMDMYRNPKPAAFIYSAFSEKNTVLEVSSSFDIGEHPACNRGPTYIYTNADSVKMYKNDVLIKEYFPEDSTFKHIKHGPILIDDFVGSALEESGDFTKAQARLTKEMLNHVALYGYKITPSLAFKAFRLVVFHGLKPSQAVPIYNKYVGDWGGESREYRFEAIKDGQVVKTVVKAAATGVRIEAKASHTQLREHHTVDVAEIRLRAVDQNDNQLYFFNEAVSFEVEGPIELIGPKQSSFRGGATGLYIRSIGEDGAGSVTIRCGNLKPVTLEFAVECL